MHECITLDYLELFCQKHQIVIGCRSGDEELWITALGPHPSGLTSAEVHEILTDSPLFEVRALGGDEEDESLIADSVFVTRDELELRIRRMMN
jgi:hypothetical protein